MGLYVLALLTILAALAAAQFPDRFNERENSGPPQSDAIGPTSPGPRPLLRYRGNPAQREPPPSQQQSARQPPARQRRPVVTRRIRPQQANPAPRPQTLEDSPTPTRVLHPRPIIAGAIPIPLNPRPAPVPQNPPQQRLPLLAAKPVVEEQGEESEEYDDLRDAPQRLPFNPSINSSPLPISFPLPVGAQPIPTPGQQFLQRPPVSPSPRPQIYQSPRPQQPPSSPRPQSVESPRPQPSLRPSQAPFRPTQAPYRPTEAPIRTSPVPPRPSQAPRPTRPAFRPERPQTTRFEEDEEDEDEDIAIRNPVRQPVRQQNRPQSRPQPRPQNKNAFPNTKREKKPVAQIIKRYREDNPDGSITWGFENDDGTFKEETIGVDCVVRGKYGYVDPDGVRREYSYSSGNPCDKTKKEEEEEDEGFLDYQNNKYVLPNGDAIDLQSIVKNRARRPTGK